MSHFTHRISFLFSLSHSPPLPPPLCECVCVSSPQSHHPHTYSHAHTHTSRQGSEADASDVLHQRSTTVSLPCVAPSGTPRHGRGRDAAGPRASRSSRRLCRPPPRMNISLLHWHCCRVCVVVVVLVVANDATKGEKNHARRLLQLFMISFEKEGF